MSNIGELPLLYYMLVAGKERKEKRQRKEKAITFKNFRLLDYCLIFETFFSLNRSAGCILYVQGMYRIFNEYELGNEMRHTGTLFYLIVFYICVICFLWNFNEFSFPERIIVLLIMSGVQCLSVVQDNHD